MTTAKKSTAGRTPRKKSPLTQFHADARELDDFVSTLDLSGNLSLLLAKPKKKSAKKK